MEVKKIILKYEQEKESLFADFTKNKIPMTEILIQQLHRMKSLTRAIGELKNNNKLNEEYKNEIKKITLEIQDDRNPIMPTFLEQIYRLKILTNTLELLKGEVKEIKPGYVN